MPNSFPDDADGAALERITSDGSDLSKPMFVNFQVALPGEAAAKQLAAVAAKLGYRVNVYPSPECSLPWTCECSTRMVANYESVVAIQHELAQLSGGLGGHPDGWGTFGNGPSGQPDVE